jgi:hypothetical protein
MNQQDFAAFVKAHGEYECGTVREGGFRTGLSSQRFVFADGALIVGDFYYDAPDRTDGGLWAWLSLQKEYYQLKLAREEREWREFKSECLQAAAFAAKYKNLPPPPPNAERQLEAGAERIQMLREKLTSLEIALAQEPNTKAKAERQARMDEMDADRQSEVQGRAAAIRGMNI